MNTPTFKEQFDKITTAYFENKLEPMRTCACFAGNLLNGNSNWSCVRRNFGAVDHRLPLFNLGVYAIERESNGCYTPDDIARLEHNFMSTWMWGRDWRNDRDSLARNEDSLFDAMDATLDMLRAIHESKGEVVESFELNKRELKPVV